MKIKIQRTHLEALDKPIPQYYGWGKSSYDTCISYYYMIPLNFFVRFWGRIKYRYYELMQNDKNRIREQRIYSRGYTEGLKSIRDRMEREIDNRVEELIKTGKVALIEKGR